MRLGARTMTKAKIDANRQNSKRSTGPRTERGKRIARFNAVTLGLFAKHIVAGRSVRRGVWGCDHGAG